MAGLEAGDLDQWITLQQLAESAGSSGFPVETWSTLDTVWASRNDTSGLERFRSGQLSAPSTTIWQLQFRSDMDPEVLNVPKTRRILQSGRIYDIVAAKQIGREEGIELTTVADSRVS